MTEEKQKSAILLIEFQKQWTSKGLYNWLIKKQLNSRNVLTNTRKLVEKARKQGVIIIHAPLIIDPKNKKGMLAHLTFGKVFTKGKTWSEISEGLFEKNDIIVRGRYEFDAFVGSDLENILKEKHIKKVFICGFTTNQCVAKTMRTMIKKKFNAFLVSDCTATLNNFFQKKTEKKFKGKTIDSNKVFEKWNSHPNLSFIFQNGKNQIYY